MLCDTAGNEVMVLDEKTTVRREGCHVRIRVDERKPERIETWLKILKWYGVDGWGVQRIANRAHPLSKCWSDSRDRRRTPHKFGQVAPKQRYESHQEPGHHWHGRFGGSFRMSASTVFPGRSGLGVRSFRMFTSHPCRPCCSASGPKYGEGGGRRACEPPVLNLGARKLDPSHPKLSVLD